MDIYKSRRDKMVAEYVRKRGLTDRRVAEAMLDIPRHKFVEPALAARAYDDYAAPIGSGQTITQPYTAALLAETAEFTGDEKILEVGTGSGYQAALMAKLVERVFTIERIAELSNRARKIFNQLGYKNIVCLVGDGTTGSAEHAPYDAIVVTAGAPQIPIPLVKQLVEGGRMIIPIHNGEEQRLYHIRRKKERFVVTKKEPVKFVPLLGKHGFKKKPSALG